MTATKTEPVTLEPRVFDSFREAFLAQQTDQRDIWEGRIDGELEAVFVLAATKHQAEQAMLRHLVVGVTKLDKDSMIRLSREAMQPE